MLLESNPDIQGYVNNMLGTYSYLFSYKIDTLKDYILDIKIDDSKPV